MVILPASRVDGHASDVDQAAADDGEPVTGLDVGHLDGVSTRVGPVHVPGDKVHRNALWRADACEKHGTGAISIATSSNVK